MTKKRILAALAIIAALVVFCLWYTRPITLEELYPGLDLSSCDEIRILSAAYHPTSSAQDPEEYQFTLSWGDPDFSLMLSKFQNRTFRRSLLDLLPRGTWTHAPQAGDFKWALALHFSKAYSLPDGSGVSGDLIQFSDFYGKLELSHDGNTWRCTTAGMDQWLSDVMDVIKTHQVKYKALSFLEKLR